MSEGKTGDFTLSPRQQARMEEVDLALREGRNPYAGLTTPSIKSEPKVIKIKEITLKEKQARWEKLSSHDPLPPIYSPGSLLPTCIGCGVEIDHSITSRYKVKLLKGFRFGQQSYSTEKRSPFTLVTSTPYFPNYVVGWACKECASKAEIMVDKHGERYLSVTVPTIKEADTLPLLTSTDQDIKIKMTLQQIKDYRERNHRNVSETVLEYTPNPQRKKARW